MDPLYLVDGSGYIFRAYFAVAKLSTSSGLQTNALLGFSKMLMKLIRDVGAKYIAVTFDTGKPTFRHEMYDLYKANRAECPEDLVPQMPYFRKIVESFGIKSLEREGFEADDVIATIARTLKDGDNEQEIVIVSGDKDLTQLVSDYVVVWDAMRDIRYDRETVFGKFGVYPEQIVDYLTLAGDSSDNIPGIRGIGPKTSAQLVSHFGSLDKMLTSIQEIEQIKGLRGSKGVKEKIESGIEALRLSKALVTLDDNVSPFNQISSVEEFSWQQPDLEQLVPLFEELEFTKLLDSLSGLNGSSNRSASNDSQKKKYHLICEENLSGFVAELGKQKSFAYDTETTGLDTLTCELVGMSFCWKAGETWYLPLINTEAPEKVIDISKVRPLLGPIFSHPSVEKIGVNLKFDNSVLAENGFSVEGPLFDAMLASYVYNPDRRQHGLKAMALTHLKEQMLTYQETVGEKSSIADVPLENVLIYAGDDAEVSFRLKSVFLKLIGERDKEGKASLRAALEDIEFPLIKVLSKMERTGFKLDVGFLRKLEEKFKTELIELEAEIFKLAGVEFNIRSSQQLAKILFEDLGISAAGMKRTKTGISTDASVLNKLADEYPIVAKVLDYRELYKLQSTYVEALQKIVHPKTGRVHTSFNQHIAATGRLSSSDPNLQNLPIKTARGRQIRDAFIAEQGFSLISADYSQIELRILAHMSGDKSLTAAFVNGEDIHLRTAKELFGEMLSENELKDYRRIAKTINFSVIYGISAFRLADQIKVPRKQAQKYIDDYFNRYPGVKAYFDSLEKDIEEKGYTETLFGHRRYVADIDTSGRDKGYAVRSLINAPLQGTAAEIIKLAMICLDKELEKFAGNAKLVSQVHDELVLEVKDDIIAEVSAIVVSSMENSAKLSVPLKVDIRSSRSWGGE
jgi:DNA polymerase-1